MRKSVPMYIASAIAGVLATCWAHAEWIPQRRTERGVARPEGPALAAFRESLGIATEYVYGLPFEPESWTAPDRMPQANESRFLPDLYRALWGHEAGPGTRGIDGEGDEQRRFLEEYYDAIATPRQNNN